MEKTKSEQILEEILKGKKENNLNNAKRAVEEIRKAKYRPSRENYYDSKRLPQQKEVLQTKTCGEVVQMNVHEQSDEKIKPEAAATKKKKWFFSRFMHNTEKPKQAKKEESSALVNKNHEKHHMVFFKKNETKDSDSKKSFSKDKFISQNKVVLQKKDEDKHFSIIHKKQEKVAEPVHVVDETKPAPIAQKAELQLEQIKKHHMNFIYTKEDDMEKISEITTKIDDLYKLVLTTKILKIEQASANLGVSETKIEQWAKMLEENKLIEIFYPAFGKIKLMAPVEKVKKWEKRSKNTR